MAVVLRAAGLNVVEVDGWKTRGRRGGEELTAVRSIIVHHTAGARAGNFPSREVLTNGRPGLSGPLCNLGVSRDGTWWCIAAGKANHAGAVLDEDWSNAFALGVECENTGAGEEWTEPFLASIERGCAALANEYDVPTGNVLGHKEVCDPPGRKPDPSTSMPNIRAGVNAARADLREWPNVALTDAEIKKLADAIGESVVAKFLATDTIPDLAAIARDPKVKGTPAGNVSPRTVLAYAFDVAKLVRADLTAPAPVPPAVKP
jgi:hypothetical protein